MVTEEEAREAADGKEVQVENVDLGTVHLQTHPEGKLSPTMEIKNEVEAIDSTDGMLKIPEDEVLVEAPSEVGLPQEHSLNGTASSPNGHMDKEENLSNKQPDGNNQNEAELEEASTDQTNGINKDEVTDGLSHGESTTENEKEQEPVGDDQQDLEGVTIHGDTVQEDSLKNGNAINQTDDDKQDQDLEPAKAIDDTKPATSTTDIPDVEVVAEAPAGVQSSMEPNLEDSDAVPDSIEGNTETDEPAKADSIVHLDHDKNFPEDTSIAEHTEEAVKVEDQQSKQANAMDAEVVQEEMPKCEETDVKEVMLKPEHADESTADAQEVLNHESPEETTGPINEKTEETAPQRSMADSEETTSEHDAKTRGADVNIQEQNLEEMEDVEAVDTEAEVQQSSVTSEEATPEDHVTTIEPCSDVQHVHNVEPEQINGPADAKDEEVTTKSNAENAAQDNFLPSEPVADIQPAQELEQTETKSTGTYEIGEAYDQTHAVVVNDLAQEDAIAASEPQMTESEELKDIESTETQEIAKHSHVFPSRELSGEDDSTENEPHTDDIQQTLQQDPVEVKDTQYGKSISTSEDTAEDNVTAEGPTCDSQEVDNVESTEEITETIAENIAGVSKATIVDEDDQAKNVLRAEDIAEKHMPELEQEETKNTEPDETKEASDQRHAPLFDDSAQEDNIPESEEKQTVSAIEIKEVEASKTEVIPQESNACVSEEPSPEDNCDTQEVSITETSEVIEGDKAIITGEISDQSNMVFAGESPRENNVSETESVQELESEEIKNTELVEVNKTSRERNATVFQMPTQEDHPTTIELHAMESAGDASNIEATEAQGAPHQSNPGQSEVQATEENITASKPQILEPESVKEMNDTEAIEPQTIFQQSLISTSEESVPEEIAPEDNITTEQDVDQQQLQDQESIEIKEYEADKHQGITSSSTVSTSEEYASEDNATATEQSSDTQAENSQSAEATEDTENVKSNTSVDEEAAVEEHVETEAAVDMSPVQEPELEEANDNEPAGTGDNMTSSDVPAEKMDTEIMETEAIPHESHVASIKELIVDDTSTSNAPNADIDPFVELESVDNTKCTDTAGHRRDPQKIIGSTSDKPTPTEENTTVTEPTFDTQVRNLTSQETKDSEDAKTDEFLYLSSFPTAKEADQESNLSIIEPIPDVQQVQELCSMEESRCIEVAETEDHQHHRVSNLQESDSEPNVEMQAQEDKLPEVKANEAMEAEEAFNQSNIATPDNAAGERGEPESDPDSYVQPVQQVELSGDNENSQHVKAEETSGQSNTIVLEETITKDTVASETGPPEKLSSEDNIATIEPTYDIQQVNDLEAVKEMNNIEAISDGEHTEIANSEDPSPTDNRATPEDHLVELNEGKMGNETENVILVHEIKEELQKSAELKDDACDLGETVLTTQKGENTTDEDAAQSGDDTLETSNNIRQVKEVEKARTQHYSSQIGEQNGENITHVQDRDIKGEFLTERGIAEASRALFESNSQAPTDGEQTSEHDNRQPGDVVLQLQTCEADALSLEKQDEAAQKVDLDQKENKEEEIEIQKEELQADEQNYQDKSDDFTAEDATEKGHDNRQPGDVVLQLQTHEADALSPEKQDEAAQKIDFDQKQNEEEEIEIQKEELQADEQNYDDKSDDFTTEDDTEKGDTIKGGEQTSDRDNMQPGHVVHQLLTCEADALSLEKQDEAVQKVDLDQKQNEEEEIEIQKEELPVDEQNYEDKSNGFTTEPIVEPQNIENGAINRTADAFESEQTEAVLTEILKNEQAPHISEESTPSSTDMKIEKDKRTDEGTEEDAGAKNDSKDVQENAEKDNIVAKDSTDEQGETTDEITNEEDPVAVPQNVESGVHREDKEFTNNVNDDVHVIQASEKEIIDEVEENTGIQNEDTDVHHDESQTKPEEEEAPQLLYNETYNTDTKIDDKTTTCEKIIHDNTSIQPREIEEIGENKGLDSISTPFVETSKQNNVEQDLSSHHKVEDEKLPTTEQNAAGIEPMQEKVYESASDINQTSQCKEKINADDVLHLETEENAFEKTDETVSNEKIETSNTATTEDIAINEDITDEASRADGPLSDESLEVLNDTRRDLDVSSVTITSKEETLNDNMEDQKFALPAQDGNIPEQALCLEETEREMPSYEKLLHTEPEENQISNEQDEEDMQCEIQIPNVKNEEKLDVQETEFRDAQQEVEQDLPVSNFLMNLILGKENVDENGNSDCEAERKQGETTEDDSCVLIAKQEENLGSLPTENKADDILTSEPEKHDIKCSEETQEMIKEQSVDIKLDTERSVETDEFNKNTRDLETPAYQDNPQDEISGELLPEEAASISTTVESRDIEISNIKLDDRTANTVCQENKEVPTETENGSLTSNQNDLINTKASVEDTLGEGQTGLSRESLPEEESVDQQTPLLTESSMIGAKDLSSDSESVQNPFCAKQDDRTKSSTIRGTSTPDIQLGSEEVDKKEEEKHASTGGVSEEHVKSSHENLQKSTSSEVPSDEQASQITEPVSDTEMTLAHEKEISDGSTCMDEKENSNSLIKGVENFQTAVEIQADGPNTQVNQHEQDEAADNETAMEPKILGGSKFQEHQKTGTEKKSHHDSEGDQHFLFKKEIVTEEQDVHETVESHKQTVSIKSNEEQELFNSKVQVQERDLNVVSPKEASEAEENFVKVTKPEFSTDEEQSPKADSEENTNDQKTKEVEGTKDFSDEAEMKTEAQGAAQKTSHKKHSLLSGVGSKVKHQLAKVKKAIVGKPGHTKPESPKS